MTFNPKHTHVAIVDFKSGHDDEGGKRFTAYRVQVADKQAGSTWELWRRFSDFHQLRSKLLKKYTRNGYQVQNFPFPPKVWFRSRTPATIASRQRMLERFMNQLLELDVLLPEVHTFLTSTSRSNALSSPSTSGSQSVRNNLNSTAPGRLVRSTSSAIVTGGRTSSSGPRAIARGRGNSADARAHQDPDGLAQKPHDEASDSDSDDHDAVGDEFEKEDYRGDNQAGTLDLVGAAATPLQGGQSTNSWEERGARSVPAMGGMAVAAMGNDGSPFLSSSLNRRRSFDETLVVGSPAGQSLLIGQMAHQARRRVSRSLHLETTVQSTLQRSKMAEAELARMVAEYQIGDANDGSGDAGLSGTKPPATLRKLKSMLDTLRSRQLALAQKWERDEKYLSKIRAQKSAEINVIRKRLTQSLDQWNGIKARNGGATGSTWVTHTGLGRGSGQRETAFGVGADGPNGSRAESRAMSRYTGELLSNWKPASDTRYDQELVDYCHQSGLNSQGFLRKQSKQSKSRRPSGLRLRQKAQKRFFYVRDDLTICYRRSNSSNSSSSASSSSAVLASSGTHAFPLTPDAKSSSRRRDADDVVAIGRLADCRLARVRDSETTFTISSPVRRTGAALKTSSSAASSDANAEVTEYVLHAESTNERDRWMKALSSLQSVIAPGRLIAGANPIEERSKPSSRPDTEWSPASTLDVWLQCVETARLHRLNAETDEYGLCEAIENLTKLEDLVAGFRFVPPVENLQTELLDFLQSKVSMCREKQINIHKVQRGGERGRVHAGLEDALVLLPRLRGFFKFVSSPDEDAVVASKADQYVSNFFPREPPFFFSEATGRWEMFQGDYASLEAALRARFFRLLQLDAAGRPNPKQAKSERTAVEALISIVALVASRDVLMDFMMGIATLAQQNGYELAAFGRKIATPILLDCHIIHGIHPPRTDEGSFQAREAQRPDGGTAASAATSVGLPYRAVVLESYTVDVFSYGAVHNGEPVAEVDSDNAEDGKKIVRVACRSRLVMEIKEQHAEDQPQLPQYDSNGHAVPKRRVPKRPLLQRQFAAYEID